MIFCYIDRMLVVYVEVILIDFCWVKVKVNLGIYLVDVFNEVCKKLNVNFDKYDVKWVDFCVLIFNIFYY